MAQSIQAQGEGNDGVSQGEAVLVQQSVWVKAVLQKSPPSRKNGAVLLRKDESVLTRKDGPVLTKKARAEVAAAVDPNSAEEIAALALKVRAAQEGDTYAMADLIEENRTWVRGIAYTVLGDAHLAEDAAQEVCVRVVKHLRGLDTPEAFRPWVYRMTRNVALSMAHRRERSPQPLSLEAEQFQDGCVAWAREDLPGAALEADERVASILDTIGRLPDIYREVLVLKHVQDLSYTEMSEILGVSVKSLEVRLVRARKLLQDRLGRRFDRGRKRDPRDEK